MKKLILVVVAGLLLAVSAGAFAQEKTKLIVMDWKLNETGPRQEWFAHVKAKFEEKFPTAEIEYLAKPFGNPYLDAILVQAAGGVPPDVVALSIIWARDLWDKGYLLDLTLYVNQSPEFQPQQFVPATQLYNQENGRIYGITHELGEALYLYDLDVFEQAGLDTDPDAVTSWDEFLSIARRLTQSDGDEIVRYGYSMPIFAEGFNTWLVANAGSFYNEDLTRAGFNSKQGTETVEFLQQLVQAGVLGGGIEEYTAAMAYSNNAAPDWLAQNAPDLRWNAASYPPGPSSTERGTTVWGNMVSIPSGSTKADLGWEFIKLYTSLEGSIANFEITGNVSSPRLDFYQSDAWLDAVDDHIWAPQFPKIALTGGVYPFLRHSDFSGQVFGPILVPAIQGESAVGGALEEAERLYNQILTAE